MATLHLHPAWLAAAVAAVPVGCARPTPNADSPNAPTLLREAIDVLSTRALGRERIDWNAVEMELLASLDPEGDPESAHDAISAAVRRLADPHARFTPPVDPIPPSVPESGTPVTTAASPSSPQVSPDRPVIPAWPQGQILDDGVAYLVVPGCTAPEADGLRAYARHAAIELRRLDAQRPAGWLIDLRLNNGGNIWPMLLGLRPLVGDGPVMTMTNGPAIVSRFGIDGSGAWIDWGMGPEPQLTWGDAGAPASIESITTRIGVLLGPWTMSSGESLAIGLMGRPRSRSFGEATAGLTTVTNLFPLSDGSVLNLPVSRMGDRNGKEFAGAIVPSIVVPFNTWPAPDDPPARAARAWLLEK